MSRFACLTLLFSLQFDNCPGTVEPAGGGGGALSYVIGHQILKSPDEFDAQIAGNYISSFLNFRF